MVPKSSHCLTETAGSAEILPFFTAQMVSSWRPLNLLLTQKPSVPLEASLVCGCGGPYRHRWYKVLSNPQVAPTLQSALCSLPPTHRLVHSRLSRNTCRIITSEISYWLQKEDPVLFLLFCAPPTLLFLLLDDFSKIYLSLVFFHLSFCILRNIEKCWWI